MANVDLYLAEACRALTHVKALLEHACGITSFESFRQLSEETQVYYMSAVRERVNAAEDAVERAKEAHSDADDDVPSKRGKRIGWGEL